MFSMLSMKEEPGILSECVVEHRALTTHNDALQHWHESGTPKKYRPLDIGKVKAAMLEYENANGE